MHLPDTRILVVGILFDKKKLSFIHHIKYLKALNLL